MKNSKYFYMLVEKKIRRQLKKTLASSPFGERKVGLENPKIGRGRFLSTLPIF
ncbi:MAG: hypothetical protein ABR980_05625 [Ignavibacteriaceae bacterium]|jgi:hypothetical protein